MRLSMKGEYGVMACYDLARFSEGEPVPLKTVAERQSISVAYLEQLIAPLRRAGLVRSLRGPQGGYALARRPEDITVGDIIRVLEGPIAPVECVAADREAGEEPRCGRAGCIARPVWEKLRDSMTQVLDSVSLADLLAGGEVGGPQESDVPRGAGRTEEAHMEESHTEESHSEEREG